MLLVRKLHDVAENWVLTFELLVGGNLHIFEILRISQGGPCSLLPFQNCPMFPCSHSVSECFRTVIFRKFVPCSQKLANVPLFPSIFCQCSLVPPNPWETLNSGISKTISRWLQRRAKRFYLIEFKMDSLSLSLSNEMTRQLLTFLLCGFLYTHVLYF